MCGNGDSMSMVRERGAIGARFPDRADATCPTHLPTGTQVPEPLRWASAMSRRFLPLPLPTHHPHTTHFSFLLLS